MKKVLTLVVLMLLIASCVSATYPAGPPIMVMGPQGRPLPGATVSITKADGTAATTYRDRAGTTTWAANPALPSSGLLQFFGSANDYMITVSGGGYTYTMYATIYTDAAAGSITDADFAEGVGYMYQLTSSTYKSLKSSLGKTSAPDPNDDVSDSWEVGSLWWDTTNNKVYALLDATDGAAVWEELTGGGISSLNGLSGTTQVFDYSNVGTTPEWSSAGTTHTLTIPDAGSGINRGLVTNSTQTITGAKTFSTSLYTAGPATFNTAGGAYDTIIRGDSDAYLFVADASADKIGIGDYTPDAKVSISEAFSASTTLEVGGNTGSVGYLHRASTATTAPLLQLEEADTQTYAVLDILYSGNTNYPIEVSRTDVAYDAFLVKSDGTVYAYRTHPDIPAYGCVQDPNTGVAFSGSGEVYLTSDGDEILEVSSTGVKVEGELEVEGVTGTGKVVCVKSDGNLGVCADQPDASGVCTCG